MKNLFRANKFTRVGWVTQTATVGELRTFLSQFRDDMPVAYTWESGIYPVDVSEYEVDGDDPLLAEETLVLNANG